MIKAVVFDWAGTMVDHGSRAPMQAFVTLFKHNGIDITIEDARGPMGVKKWDHIQALLELPHVGGQFLERNGRIANKSDIDDLLTAFIPMNAIAIKECADLIEGARACVEFLRQHGIKVGSNTGYTRDLMDILMPLAKAQGYSPDCCYCAGDTPEGRPSPQMLEKIAADFGITDPKTMIKVDDTLPGILEGKSFGCITVGVAISGNALGLSLEELNAFPIEEAEILKEAARKKVRAMNPDYVIDSVAELPELLQKLMFIAQK